MSRFIHKLQVKSQNNTKSTTIASIYIYSNELSSMQLLYESLNSETSSIFENKVFGMISFHEINHALSLFLKFVDLIIHDELRSQLRLIDMKIDQIVYTYIARMIYVCSIVS